MLNDESNLLGSNAEEVFLSIFAEMSLEKIILSDIAKIIRYNMSKCHSF